MTNNILEYKGYYTRVEFSVEDRILYGKIEGINDLITFECDDISEIENAFRETVDDYLTICEANGKQPDKVYKGTFNVRVSPILHREASMKALSEGISLNQYVENAIQAAVSGSVPAVVVIQNPHRPIVRKRACDLRTFSNDDSLSNEKVITLSCATI